MRTTLLGSLLFLCLSCKGSGETDTVDDTDEDSGSVDTSGLPCGEAAPVVQVFTIGDGGPYSDGDTIWPSILLHVQAHDDDGDLTAYRLEVAYDAVLDGSVSIGEAPFEVDGVYGYVPCGVFTLPSDLRIAVTGNPPYDTDLEWGVLVYDVEGHASDGGVPAVTVFHTPLSDGTYP